MGSKNESKAVNSYSLLNMKMNEVVKCKKKENVNSNSLKNSSSSSMNKSKFLSEPTTSDGKYEKSSSKEKELPPSFKKQNDDPNVPDRSYGDFFCPICDSHMNSEDMWEAHIIGKRHLKNIKKNDPDTKYEDLGVESNIKHEIKNVKEAIVGLSYIQEIRRKEVGAPPLYTCYLCQATFANTAMVIEHVITMKHRLNYIKENSRDDYDLLYATNLKKGQLEPLVEEVAAKLEHKWGTGTVKVKQEKAKPLNFPSKRVFTISDDDDDDVHDLPKRAKTQKHDPFVWKSVGGYHKNADFTEIQDCREILERKRMLQYTSDEDADMHKQGDPIKRPVFNRHSRKYRASSPPSLESSKMERSYSRPSNPFPAEDNYSPYSHNPGLPLQEPLKRDPYSSRYLTSIPTSKHSPPRSYNVQEKEPPSLKNYPSATETKQEADSNTAMLKDFVQKIYSLPTEIFLKIALLKLDNMEVKGVDELNMLFKVINKAHTIFCNKLPGDIEAIVRQKMFRSADTGVQKSPATPPLTNQIAESSNIENNTTGSDFRFIRDVINQARLNASSPSVHNTVTPHQAPHQNITSYQSSSYGNSSTYPAGNILPSNVNYSYNSANSATSSTTASIPGLTLAEENRQAQLYNTYQAPYSDPSSYPYRY